MTTEVVTYIQPYTQMYTRMKAPPDGKPNSWYYPGVSPPITPQLMMKHSFEQ